MNLKKKKLELLVLQVHIYCILLSRIINFICMFKKPSSSLKLLYTISILKSLNFYICQKSLQNAVNGIFGVRYFSLCLSLSLSLCLSLLSLYLSLSFSLCLSLYLSLSLSLSIFLCLSLSFSLYLSLSGLSLSII